MSTTQPVTNSVQLLNLLIACFDKTYSKDRITSKDEPITRQRGSKFILSTNDTDQIVYSFGLKYWYKDKWRKEFTTNNHIMVESHYNNLKDELIDSGGKILFSTNRWNQEIETAMNHRQTDSCKENCTTTTASLSYFIKSDTLISTEHLIALQLYCNTTIEQTLLCESYRFVRYDEGNQEVFDDTIEDIVKQHSFYANWGRLLHEAVNVFGNRQWEQEFFYHGIDKEMMFTKTTFFYIYAPLSTTLDINFAINKLSNDSGMVIKVDGTMNNCFDCKWINNKNEDMFVFIGGMQPFRIDDVWIHRKSWISVRNYLSAINEIIEEDYMQCEDSEQECSIKTKLLQIKHEISGLSFNELQNSLNQFACKIIESRHKDNEAQLKAVGWIVKLFHCYLRHIDQYNYRNVSTND